MSCGIYKITNLLNGKSYIGASTKIEERWIVHKYKSQTRIGRIIHENGGASNFTFTILKECPKFELCDYEQYYIDLYNTEAPNGYNLSKGGEHNFNTTGYWHVSKSRDESSKLGYYFLYSYGESNNRQFISSGSLKILENKVKEKGLIWKVLDEDVAKLTLDKNELDLKEINFQTKSENSTGFYHVAKVRKRGYFYYYLDDSKNVKHINSVNIEVLEEKVESRGLPWEILDEEKAAKTIKESAKYNENTPNQKRSIVTTNTGFYRVGKSKDDTCSSGAIYIYQYSEKDKRKKISSVNLGVLEEKVKSKGLPWEVVDEHKAKMTIEESVKNNKNYKRPSNKTGFYGVYVVTTEKYSQGFYYKYNSIRGGKNTSISSKDLMKLKEKVESRGCLWEIIDEEKAKKTLEKERNKFKNI